MKNTFLLFLGLVFFIAIFGCAKQEQEIKIGAVLPLTGDAAIYGQMARKAAELAVEEINSSGDISGKKLTVIYEDTQLNPQITSNAVNKLIAVDKVSVIVGPMASNTLLAVAPIVEKNKVVLISPAATSHKITEAGDYIFRTIVSDIYDGTAMAQYAYNKAGYRNVGIFYVDEEGPRGVTNAFMNEFKRLGGKIPIAEKSTRDGTDFRSEITKIRNANPDAVYFAGYANETVLFLRQARELRLNKQLMTHQLIDDPEIIKRAGETANGVIFTTPKLTPETGGQAVKDFFERFKQKYNGEEPQNFAPNTYDAIMLIAQAMRKYGTDAKSIKRGLYEVKNFQGASGNITIDQNGDVVQPMMIMTIRDGRVLPLQK